MDEQKFSLKAIKFSRYLMIRYFTAFYFFTNLFWLIFAFYYQAWLACTVAVSMLILLVVASIEQFSKWHTDNVNLPKTKFYYQIQILTNLVLTLCLIFKVGKIFFPFSTSTDTNYLVLGILIIGLLGSILVIKRINNIAKGHDRYNKVIDLFEKQKV